MLRIGRDPGSSQLAGREAATHQKNPIARMTVLRAAAPSPPPSLARQGMRHMVFESLSLLIGGGHDKMSGLKWWAICL
jgi:hypothetical protein